MKKKLTYGGGAPLVLSVIALVLALGAAFQEYLARFIYNLMFDSDAEKIFVNNVAGFFTRTKNSVSVISLYTEKAFILVLVSLVVTLVLLGAKSKKKIVAGEAWITMITAAACAIEPIMYICYFFSSDFKDGFTADSDGVRFRCFYGFLIYALPMIICVLLFFAGLILAVRLGRETFSVEIEERIKTPAAPDLSGFAAAPVAPAFIPDVNNSANVNNAYTPAPQPVPAPVMEEAVYPQQPAAEAVIEVANDVASPAAEETAAEAVQAEPEVDPIITEEAPKAAFCNVCGQELAYGAKFCKNCGAKQA